MKTLPSLKEAVLLLFHHMQLRFDGDRFPDLEASFQFIFTDIDDGFPVHLRFSRGTAAYTEGLADRPSVTIRTPASLWLDISGGSKSPVWAMMTRRITVEGQRSLLRLLSTTLTKKVAVLSPPGLPGAWTEPKRVLAMIGNPRRKNGLTWFYLQPFLDGMRQAGASVEEIMLYDRKIGHCLGCFHCWTRTPGQCIQKDDQAGLMEKMDAADLVLYAMPLYYHSMPGLVKDHFDRQLPMVLPSMEKADGITRHPRRNPVSRSTALFSVCGFPEIEQFDPLVRTVETYANLGNTRFATPVLIPGAMKLYHDPTQRSRLLMMMSALRSAGEQIVGSGAVDRKTARIIRNAPSSLVAWHENSNWYWQDELERGKAAVK